MFLYQTCLFCCVRWIPEQGVVERQMNAKRTTNERCLHKSWQRVSSKLQSYFKCKCWYKWRQFPTLIQIQMQILCKLLSTFHTRNTHQEYFTLMATLNKNHHPAYSSTPVRNDQSITRTTQSPAHLVTIPVDLDLIPTFLGAASNHAKAGKWITTDLAVSTFCDGDMISRPFSRSVNISSNQEINERKGNTRVFVWAKTMLIRTF